MKRSEIIQNASGLKAVNAFIFAGSFSLGTMAAGFDLLKVLEISDDQLQSNAFYFKKNVEDVPVILPKEWENDAYLDALKSEEVDLMCCNCPCSSLSQINRNASVDGKNNIHFYRLFNIFKHVQPKAFVIENAPTLVKLGLPILKKLTEELGDMYRFTIVRDHAGNHEVAMSRMRTLVIGWRRDVFSRCPVIQEDHHPMVTVKDTLGDMYDDTTNDLKSTTSDEISFMYKWCEPKFSLMSSLARQCQMNENAFQTLLADKLQNYPGHLREVQRIVQKIELGCRWWDKTPYKLVDDERFPSLTSVSEFLHPYQDRTLNKREYARIMNYPDWYDFNDSKNECKVPVIQAIAQGVPANFGKYAAMQVRLAFEGKQDVADENAEVVFQHHSKHKWSSFTFAEFNEVQKELDVKADDNRKLER